MNSEGYRRLVETHFPEVEIRTCVPIEMGWDYFVLDVNDELIFRFPRRPDVVQQLEWEIEILPMLRDVLPVRVPEFEYVATPKEGDLSKFVGYQKIIGSQLDAEKLKTSGTKDSMARGLGDFLIVRILLAGEKCIDGCLNLPKSTYSLGSARKRN
jgi:aminoglycoside 2''-phosphotransferase